VTAGAEAPAEPSESPSPPGSGSRAYDDELSRAAKAVADVAPDAVILLACHVNPDGDALGSMLAFGLGLRRLGYTAVRASFPEPYGVPEVFRFLPGLDLLVAPAAAPAAPALAVSFDAASPARLGALTHALAAAPTWIMLDHHLSNVGFGSVRLVDPAAAATAVVAADLLDRLGVDLDRDIATCLYVGLATDTGSFRFDTTTPAVLQLAARLVTAGAQPAEVARRVFDTRPFAAIRLLAAVLDRVVLEPGAARGLGLISAYATAAELDQYGQSVQALESFMDVIRTAAEADVACLLKPVGPDEWAVSLRSRGGTDVAAVAVALGGGGHRLAAGFTGRGGAGDVLAAVRERLDLG
jgi:bifunctional oligoribonuclease and PAP phosphatase NrnA